jgi:DNA methylase
MFSRSNSMAVERVAIDSVSAVEPPVRHHPKKQFEKVCRSVAANGQVMPVLVSPEGKIIDHELVWRALKANGASHVDVIVIKNKSSAELKALRLMLNRSAMDAVWDDENLRNVLQDLIDLNFDLELTGFDPAEIDHHINLDLPRSNVEENGSDIPGVDERAVSSRGSIWALGDHRIGCGNATDYSFVSRVLAGRLAHVSFVDMPYNIPVHGFISGKGSHRHRESLEGAGELSTEAYFVLVRDSLSVLQRCSLPTSLIYSCIDWRHVMEMTVAGRACGMPLYQIVTWVKSSGGMGGVYRNQSEFICIFRAGQGTPLDNVELGRRGRNRTNVWNYPGMSSFGKGRDELLKMHPTVKPVSMIADALRDVTRRGEVVLDTFLGSGSSILAAQETGRIGCGVELDPLYVDVAVRRWQNATGREAFQLHTGESFNSTAQRLLSAPSGTDHGA